MYKIRKGVLILVYTKVTDGRYQYLLVRQQHGGWSLPSGGIEPGEDEQQAAIRELAEETGIKQPTLIPTSVINSFAYDNQTRGEQQGFICLSSPQEVAGPQGHDHVQSTAWVDKDEAKSYLIRPQQYTVFEQLIQQIPE